MKAKTAITPKLITPDEIRRVTVPFELKAAALSVKTDGASGENGDEADRYAGEFEGYAAGILNIDRTGDLIVPGAFTDGLATFLDEGVVCWQHKWDEPIGKCLEAREDGYGLWTRSRISKTLRGVEAMTLIRDNVVKKMSIGYRVHKYEAVDRAGLITFLETLAGVPAQRREGIVRQYDEMDLRYCYLLQKISLYEYSPVSIPANPNASITSAKGNSYFDLLNLKSLLAELETRTAFKSHSADVEAALQGYAEAAGVMADIAREVSGYYAFSADSRQKAGRKISAASREQIATCCAEMETAMSATTTAHGRLMALINEPDDDEEDDNDDDKSSVPTPAQLYTNFLRLEAQSLGCGPATA